MFRERRIWHSDLCGASVFGYNKCDTKSGDTYALLWNHLSWVPRAETIIVHFKKDGKKQTLAHGLKEIVFLLIGWLNPFYRHQSCSCDDIQLRVAA